MTRSAPCRFLVLTLSLTSLHDVNAHRKSELRIEDRDGLGRELGGSSWPFVRPSVNENELAPRREKALQRMQEILGIRSQNENLAHREVPPQFMMELYNTVADASGVTRGRNPYNARVVRSFVEKDSSLSHLYFFNVSGLEMNESVLEAELHLYRKKTPPRNVPMSASPYYLIRVYQVLDDRSLDVPDLHRLLNARYVGAHASGWQIFNVKQAVLGWRSGEPNLGLLVTAQNLSEDEALMEFSRRNDYRYSKQPILVLFDDDSSDRPSGRSTVAPRYYAYGNQDDDEREGPAYEENAGNEKNDLGNSYDDVERYRRYKRQREGDGQPEEVSLASRREPEFFQRQKRRREEEEEEEEEEQDRASPYGEPLETTRRRRRDATSPRGGRASSIASKDRRSRVARILTSMDIYERAAYREKLGQVVRDRSASRRPAKERRRRPARSASDERQPTVSERPGNATECTRHEFYVDFRDIGLSSSIVAPPGYDAYQCKGACEPPLSQDQRPTNHATIQAIVHKMNKDVGRPCCVPTKLLGISILFLDENQNVVLKMYEDMVADRCGCR